MDRALLNPYISPQSLAAWIARRVTMASESAGNTALAFDGGTGAHTRKAALSAVVDFGPFHLYPQHRKLFFQAEEVQLGGRAMDVLLALAREKGGIVTKEQLFEAAWPNVTVHESNLKVTVASLRRALRECSSSHEYITTVVGRGYWLRDDVQPQGSCNDLDHPVVTSPPLPELGTVIGREVAIAELRETLAQNRLTTIVGSGGIGKTTVAVAVAQLFEDEGGGAVTFVDLARFASHDFVPSSLD